MLSVLAAEPSMYPIESGVVQPKNPDGSKATDTIEVSDGYYITEEGYYRLTAAVNRLQVENLGVVSCTAENESLRNSIQAYQKLEMEPRLNWRTGTILVGGSVIITAIIFLGVSTYIKRI